MATLVSDALTEKQAALWRALPYGRENAITTREVAEAVGRMPDPTRHALEQLVFALPLGTGRVRYESRRYKLYWWRQEAGAPLNS
jgi:hypothetical protein